MTKEKTNLLYAQLPLQITYLLDSDRNTHIRNLPDLVNLSNGMSNTLSIEEAIEIQTRHLEEWRLLLKPEVFERLKVKVIETNNQAKTGYDICRGDAISNIIYRAAYYELI